MRTLQTRRNFMAGLALSGLAPFVTGGAAHAECRRRRGLVNLSEFPDLQLRIDENFAAERFRGLDRYVREMSYGQDCLDIRLNGWHRLPAPITVYAISPVNLKVDKTRIVKLIQDSIDAVDRSEDFSRYDFVAIFMRARFVDYGMVGLCGYPGMLGWQSEVPFRTRSGQAVPGGVAIFTASAHLGTLFHDCAHVWGGVREGKRVVPCLYDHDLQALYPTIDKGWANALINMGFWDPMSCHSYKRELPPPGASSWTKLRLGWLAENKVRVIGPGKGITDILLGPLADGSAETLAVRIPLSPTRYVLIE